jgi:hypothetical protein
MLQEKPPALKENIKHFKTWNLYTFSILVKLFFNLPEPNPAGPNQCVPYPCGSGSTTRAEDLDSFPDTGTDPDPPFQVNPDPDPGFDDQKLKKKIQLKFFLFF